MSDIVTELRKPKIAGIAIFDLSITAFFAILFAEKYNVSKLKSIVGFIALGEAIHLAAGIHTPVTKEIKKSINDEVII